MRPILALNCLLQIEQHRSEEERFVDDALALALRCARFCSALLISFASHSPAPLLMRPRHFFRSFAICSHDSVGMLKSLREALRVVLVSLLLTTMGAFSSLKFSIEEFLWQTFIRHSGYIHLPVHLNCANFIRICTFCIPVLFRTSVSGILSCHLIFKKFSKVARMEVVKSFGMRIKVLAAQPICILLA